MALTRLFNRNDIEFSIEYAIPNWMTIPSASTCSQKSPNVTPKLTGAEIIRFNGDCIWEASDLWHNMEHKQDADDYLRQIRVEQRIADKAKLLVGSKFSVGIHHRCGDFRRMSDPLDPRWYHYRLEEEYILNRIKLISETVDELTVFVASDGTHDELSFLKAMPRTVFGDNANPGMDLVSLSHCNLIIGNPSSTFSTVAGKLLGRPVIYPWHSQHDIQNAVSGFSKTSALSA